MLRGTIRDHCRSLVELYLQSSLSGAWSAEICKGRAAPAVVLRSLWITGKFLDPRRFERKWQRRRQIDPTFGDFSNITKSGSKGADPSQS